MKCPKCLTDNLSDAAFCEECGAALEAACPACGTGNRAGAKFCRKCRTSLNGAATAVPEPRAHIGKHLADKILGSRAALEGERKLVTVLFADVKSSMELAEQLDPEQWSAIMKRFFAILSEGVERFEGYVDKFTGDGIMALFGAPIAHEDHARRACYAALHLQDTIRSYATELRLHHGLNFSARIGLNSGEVIVGKIGDDLRMDYTAQGHTVGLAARMEQIAEPGKIYLTAHTAHELQGYFALADLGEIKIKGVNGAVHVHELQGLGQARTRIDVSKSRGFSRFVGRGDEMQMLEAALARTAEGNGQIVGIVGEAGLGKSRLCYEFLERCRARGLMAQETAGVAHGKAIPFLPMLRLFRAFFGIADHDNGETAREKIAGRLLLLDERLRESLPQVFAFMGVADPEQPAPRIDPEARQRQLFDIVRRVNQIRGQKETTVTLLEDLHWFDGGSEALLEPLFDATAGARRLFVVNFRPEYRAPWMSRSNYHQIPLGPLPAEAIGEMLDALLGRDPSLGGLGAAIWARAAGNPFFVEEIVQSLIESGKLQGSKGAYRLVTPVEKLEIPSSVHALIAARIDRLAQREKDVLQTAAVIGREFDEPTLAAVVEQEAPQLREALQMLKDAEFVHEQALYPVAEYRFKHPLTHEVALGSQLQERRRRLHAAVARVIEAAHTGDDDDHAALLAHHWEDAADPGQAVRWHARAADWAGVRDLVAGVRHWIKVRELGRSLDDDGGKALRLRACGTIMAQGSWRLGMSDHEVRDYLDEARALAHALGTPSALSVPLAGLAARSLFAGRAAKALELAAEAKDMLDDRAELEVRVGVEIACSSCAAYASGLRQAQDAIDRVIRLCDGNLRVGHKLIGYSALTWADFQRGWVLAQAGRFDECWPLLERALRIARERGEQELLGWTLSMACGCAYWASGASRAPVADLRKAAIEATEIADNVGSRFSQIGASEYLGVALFLGGDHDACVERLTEALVQARAERIGLQSEGMFLAVVADALRARGDAEGAVAKAREGIAVADAGGAWFQAALPRAALADALVVVHAPVDSISAVIAEARALVEKGGGNSLLPRLREAEARMVGRSDGTLLRVGLREAEQMYRSMGAPDPAERLARELAASG